MSIKSRFVAILLVFDELGNAILGPAEGAPCAGNPHYTISQRLAELRKSGRRAGCIGCAVLNFFQNKIFRIPGDHCTGAMEGWPDDLPSEG